MADYRSNDGDAADGEAGDANCHCAGCDKQDLLESGGEARWSGFRVRVRSGAARWKDL